MSQTKLLSSREGEAGGKQSEEFLYQSREGPLPRLPIPYSSATLHSPEPGSNTDTSIKNSPAKRLKIEDQQEIHKSCMKTVEFVLLLASTFLVGQHVLKDNQLTG